LTNKAVTKKPEAVPFPSLRTVEGNDEEDDTDDSDDSGASLVFSPSTVRGSPGYKTALPARAAGKPKMVSIKKTSRPAANTKTKRQSSIRRLAAKLGAKAARREVAVYKPSESAVDEDPDAEKASMTTEGSSGTRRSRRLLEQQRDQARPGSIQSTISKVSTSVGTPPKPPSKLKKNQVTVKAHGDSSDGSKSSLLAARTPESPSKPGAVPSLSLMMADWEIAPGRIRVGTGDDADSEEPHPPYSVHNGRKTGSAKPQFFQTSLSPRLTSPRVARCQSQKT